MLHYPHKQIYRVLSSLLQTVVHLIGWISMSFSIGLNNSICRASVDTPLPRIYGTRGCRLIKYSAWGTDQCDERIKRVDPHVEFSGASYSASLNIQREDRIGVTNGRGKFGQSKDKRDEWISVSNGLVRGTDQCNERISVTNSVSNGRGQVWTQPRTQALPLRPLGKDLGERWSRVSIYNQISKTSSCKNV